MYLLSGSPSKSGPFDFATNNIFPLFFAGQKALVQIYEIHNSCFQILYFHLATSKKLNSGHLSFFDRDRKT